MFLSVFVLMCFRTLLKLRVLFGHGVNYAFKIITFALEATISMFRLTIEEHFE